MALVYLDRAQETSTTEGSGAYDLDGAVLGYQDFSGVGNGNTCYYAATNGRSWEVGLGTYIAASSRLIRTSVLDGSNGTSPVNWPRGTKYVWIDYPADVIASTISGPTTGTGPIVRADSPVFQTQIQFADAATAAQTRENLSAPVYVPTRTALSALDTTKDTVAILTEGERSGLFVWRSGNYSTFVATDTQQGVYVKADAISAAVGAWVRPFPGPLSVLWFGAIGDGNADDTTSVHAALNFAIAYTGSLYFPGNKIYRVTSGYTKSQVGNLHIIGSQRFSSQIQLDSTDAASFFLKNTTTTTYHIENMRFRCAQYVLDRKFFWFAAAGGGANQNFWNNVVFTSVELPMVFDAAALCQSVSMYDVRWDDSGTIHMSSTVGNIRTLLTMINCAHDGSVPDNTAKVVMDLSGARMVQGTNLLLEGTLPGPGYTILKIGETYDSATFPFPEVQMHGFWSEWANNANAPDAVVDQTRGIAHFDQSFFGMIGTTKFKYKLHDRAIVYVQRQAFLYDSTPADVFFTRDDTFSYAVLEDCTTRAMNWASTWVKTIGTRSGGGNYGNSSYAPRCIAQWQGSLPQPGNSIGLSNGTTYVIATDATYGRKITITPGTTYSWRWAIPRGPLVAGDQLLVVARIRFPTWATGDIRIQWRENGAIVASLQVIGTTSPEMGTVYDFAYPITLATSTGDIAFVLASPSLPTGIVGDLDVLGLEFYTGGAADTVIHSVFPTATEGWGTAAPTTGTWVAGDTVWNTAPAAGGTPGWRCTTGGTPGTWNAMANLAP